MAGAMTMTSHKSAFVGAQSSNRLCRVQSSARRVQAVRIQATVQTEQTSATNQTKLQGPEPQTFVVAEGQLENIASAAFPAMIRAASGGFCTGYKPSLKKDDGSYAVVKYGGFAIKETSAVSNFRRPVEMLEFYDDQASAGSRKVREAITILDLNVLFYPCPTNGPTWRARAKEVSGSDSAPVLVDNNNGKVFTDADEIVEYLFRIYGNRKVPFMLQRGAISDATCKAAVNVRSEVGGRVYRPSKLPAQPLEVWTYELSPFSVVVKEKLNELEIPHVQRGCGRGSPQREELFQRRGKFQAPYLEDPNTGVAMFESTAIMEYLEKTYAQ